MLAHSTRETRIWTLNLLTTPFPQAMGRPDQRSGRSLEIGTLFRHRTFRRRTPRLRNHGMPAEKGSTRLPVGAHGTFSCKAGGNENEPRSTAHGRVNPSFPHAHSNGIENIMPVRTFCPRPRHFSHAPSLSSGLRSKGAGCDRSATRSGEKHG